MTDTTVAELEALFEAQKSAFLNNVYPSYEERMGWLKSLEQMMLDCRQPARDALQQDFGSHHPLITDLFETGGVLGRTRHIQAHLEEWMAPDKRPLEPLVHGSSTVEVVRQPKGVMGNISPWNFPIECALVMAADMLAAGNRVIVKTSELSPATSAMLRNVVGKYFSEDVLAVVNGGVELSQKFSSMPWNQLTFTGSTAVGRIVLEAAAKNLTPVTLELGGKNPTVFAEDGVEEQLIKEFLSFKFCKSGQICTSPDYAFVPEAQLDQWLEIVKSVWSEAYPSYIGHPDVTGMINEKHYDRVMDLIDEASESSAEVMMLSDEVPSRELRQIPMCLVVNPTEDLGVMREEIFGPIIPVMTYKSLDEVWNYINSHSRPLASYLVTKDIEVADQFSTAVISGGAAVNVFGFQAAEPAVPFGGVGASGMGCHGGFEGFLNYSHSKSLYRCADDNPLKSSLVVPYGELLNVFADAIFAQPE